MRFTAAALRERGVADERIHVSLERNMQCASAHCGHCQLGPVLRVPDGPVFRYAAGRAPARGAGAVTAHAPTQLAVWKFASCDGCQLSLLDCEDELLASPARSRSPTSWRPERAPSHGPYDLSLVEGSITTAARRRAHPRGPAPVPAPGHDRRLRHRRRHPGAAQLRRRRGVHPVVYASPDYISTLATSTPIADHVPVDFELRGCPIDKRQLLEVLSRVPGRPPARACRTTACASSASGAAPSA